jgi:hypothetical protein
VAFTSKRVGSHVTIHNTVSLWDGYGRGVYYHNMYPRHKQSSHLRACIEDFLWELCIGVISDLQHSMSMSK